MIEVIIKKPVKRNPHKNTGGYIQRRDRHTSKVDLSKRTGPIRLPED